MAKLRNRNTSNPKLNGGHRPRAKHNVAARRTRLHTRWTSAVSDEQWPLYRRAIDALQSAGITVLLGGGFAMATYTGRWRNTKDIDFYIRFEDRERAVQALSEAGFVDYFDTLPYDRKWIYRSTRDGVIVDIIWAMANQRAQVDDLWFDNASSIAIREVPLKVVPVEEFIWCKLYILQRDHCDWTDVLNVLYATGPTIDWDHLLNRLEEDWPLLKALLTLYGWLCPRRAALLPETLRRRLDVDRPVPPKRKRFDRIRLLDTRDWFAGVLAPDKPLAV